MSTLDRNPDHTAAAPTRTASTPPGRPEQPGDTGREPALTRLIRLMIVDLALGLVVAALTWLGHDAIVDHQVAVTGQARSGLSATLWSRTAVSVAVAFLYPLFIRRLRRHERRGWRRTVIVSVVQMLGLAWYAIGSGYPIWLSAVVAAQALAALAVLIAATRPDVRRLFGFPAPTALDRAGHRAAIALVVIAPVVAELTWGSTRATQLVGIVLYAPTYGACALLIREVVRRRGLGLPSILVFGVAYGILEEGVGLQSLTSRTLFPSMVGLSPQVGHVNVAYTVMVLTYHAVFSIAIPIALAERLAPAERRRDPWLARPTTVVVGVVGLLGFGLIRLIPITADPHYLMPWAWDVGFGVLVVLLVVAALRLPRAHTLGGAAGGARPPRPLAVGMVTGLAALVFLGLLMPLPNVRYAAWMPSATMAFVPIVVTLAELVVVVAVGVRWSRSGGWSAVHTVAAITGALIAHTLIGLLALTHTPVDRGFLALLGAVEIVLLVLLLRHVTGRMDRAAPHSVGS